MLEAPGDFVVCESAGDAAKSTAVAMINVFTWVSPEVMEAGARDFSHRPLRFMTGTTWQLAGGFSSRTEFRFIGARKNTPAFTARSGAMFTA
ncbi:hypothetical protein [Bradyrhizobium sp. 23AC]